MIIYFYLSISQFPIIFIFFNFCFQVVESQPTRGSFPTITTTAPTTSPAFHPSLNPTSITSNNISQFLSDKLIIENYVGNSRNPSPQSYAIWTIRGDTIGNIYCNAGNQLIRKVSNYGQTISLFAGNGGTEIIENVFANETGIGSISSLAVDLMGNVIYADNSANIIRRVLAENSTINTIAGIHYSYGYSYEGPATSSYICSPNMMWIDSQNNIYVTHGWSPGIYLLTWNGDGTYNYHVFAGIYSSFEFYFQQPSGIGGDTLGNIYVSDVYYQKIFVIRNNLVQSVAGGGDEWGSTVPTAATLSNPNAIWVDTLGNVYFTNNNQVQYLSLNSSMLSVVAGSGNFGYSGDGGPPINADFSSVTDIWVNLNTDLFLADQENSRIRVVPSTADSILLYTDFLNGDGGPASQATSAQPSSLWGDSLGNLYFVDNQYCTVRKVDAATGIITTIGGTIACNWNENSGEPFNDTQLTPALIALTGDTLGNIYVLDNMKIKVANVSQDNNVKIYNYPVISSTDSFSSIVSLPDGSILITSSNDSTTTKFFPSSQRKSVVVGSLNIAGSSGDGGPAVGALLNGPHNVWIDSNLNIYIADTYNNKVRVVTADGIINLVAGNGTQGFTDNILAFNAQLNNPYGIAGDSNGIIFVADTGNNRIRMIYLEDGEYHITTIIGNGNTRPPGYQPTVALSSFSAPEWIWVDQKNNIYTMENYENQYWLRKTSYVGDYETPTSVPSASPTLTETDVYYENFVGSVNQGFPPSYTINTIWGDTLGNIYTDANRQFLRNVSNNGNIINTIAGSQSYGSSRIVDGQFANATDISFLTKVWGDTLGNLFYVDGGLNLLVKILAETKTLKLIAPVTLPNFVWSNTAGQLFISKGRGEWGTNCVIELSLNQTEGVANETAYICDLQFPTGVWGDTLGMIYVISEGDGTMWAANKTFSGQLAGSPRRVIPTDDEFSLGSMYTIGGSVNGIWLDSSTGKIYFTDGQKAIVYDPVTDEARTFAGGNLWSVSIGDEGPAKDASLDNPTDIWGDSNGNIYIADSQNGRIRRVDMNETIHTFFAFNYGNGGPATDVSIGYVAGMWGDSEGNLFYVDQPRCVIRKVDIAGIITTPGGNFDCDYSSGQSENSLLFDQISLSTSVTGFWIDSNSDYYFIDKGSIQQVSAQTQRIKTLYNSIVPSYSNLLLVGDTQLNFYIVIPDEYVIMKVGVNGTSIIAGQSYECYYNGDGIPAVDAILCNPTGLWIDSLNALYIADQDNYRVRKIGSDGIIQTIAGNGNYDYWYYNGDYGEATAINLCYPTQVTGDDRGNVFVSDLYHNTIRMLTPQADPGEYFLRTIFGEDPYYQLSNNYYGYPYSMWMDSKRNSLYATFQMNGYYIIYKATIEFDEIQGRRMLIGNTEKIESMPLPSAQAQEAPTSSPSFHPHLNVSAVNYVSSPQFDSSPLRYTINTLWGDVNGTIYCDTNEEFIQKITNKGNSFAVIAGTGGALPPEGFIDGTPANATVIMQVTKIWGDTVGNLYYVDNDLQMIIEIAATTKPVRVVAAISSPLRMWGNTAGQLFVTQDGGVNCIQQLNINNPRTNKMFQCGIYNPRGIWGDSEGNIYFIGYSKGKLLKTQGMNEQKVLIGAPMEEDDEFLVEPAHYSNAYNTYGLWVDTVGGIYYTSSWVSGIEYYNPETGFVTPFAGSFNSGFYGDNGPATAAALNYPTDVWGDTNGNIFIADTSNSRIRKVTPDGIIHTVIDYIDGDGGPATSVHIQNPSGMWVNSMGDLFYLDQGNCAIRRVNPRGIIFLFGGTFVCGYGDDGMSANQTQITQYASALWGDNAGNYYYIDSDNLRKIDNTQDILISTLYYSVTDDGNNKITSQNLAPQEQYFLFGDNKENFFLAIPFQHVIKRFGVNGEGYYGIYGGVLNEAGFNGDNLFANETLLNYPGGIWIDTQGGMYVADQLNNRIRCISTSHIVTTIAGSAIAGYNGDGIPATSAWLDNPCSIVGDSKGNLYVADRDNDLVRMLTPIDESKQNYVISTVLGQNESYIRSLSVSMPANNYYPLYVLVQQGSYVKLLSEKERAIETSC